MTPSNPKPRYKDKYRVESTRLPGWNYASNGGYFVTICTYQRQCFFGEVVTGEMRLSPPGAIVQRLWQEIPNHFPDCHLDIFCVMPNHVHGIIIINQQKEVFIRNTMIEEDAIHRVSTRRDTQHRQRGGITGKFNPMLSKNSLSKIIRWYKGRCKFEISQIEPSFGWQERFHDEIIRNEFALHQIRQYIIDNPIKSECDRENQSHPFL